MNGDRLLLVVPFDSGSSCDIGKSYVLVGVTVLGIMLERRSLTGTDRFKFTPLETEVLAVRRGEA